MILIDADVMKIEYEQGSRQRVGNTGYHFFGLGVATVSPYRLHMFCHHLPLGLADKLLYAGNYSLLLNIYGQNLNLNLNK